MPYLKFDNVLRKGINFQYVTHSYQYYKLRLYIHDTNVCKRSFLVVLLLRTSLSLLLREINDSIQQHISTAAILLEDAASRQEANIIGREF